MRCLLVFGTRPEAIKMAPLVLGMNAAPDQFTPIVCVTGQHREMLRQALDTFGIKAHHDLAVMTPNQSLAEMTSRILEGVCGVIDAVGPEVVMVQGDTTTAFAAALAGFYRGVPVAHVEAGLRSGDLRHPFPEELNRALIDRFAALCFAPTPLNRRTLLAEGIPRDRILVTGNTGIDALLVVRERVRAEGAGRWDRLWKSARGAVHDRSRRLILVTLHRRESFGGRIAAIFEALRDLAQAHPEWELVYPVHLNPNVRVPARKKLAGLRNVHLIDPLPYEPFVFLMDRACLIVTDSGGIQEEAPSLRKPVVVMREATERREVVRAGNVILAGNSGRGLQEAVERMMRRQSRSRGRAGNPYGDGRAAERILSHLRDFGARRGTWRGETWPGRESA